MCSIIMFILGLWPFQQLLLFPPAAPPCSCCVQVLEGDRKPVFLFCAAEEPLHDKSVPLRHSQCQELNFGIPPAPFPAHSLVLQEAAIPLGDRS